VPGKDKFSIWVYIFFFDGFNQESELFLVDSSEEAGDDLPRKKVLDAIYSGRLVIRLSATDSPVLGIPRITNPFE
jgi:hypothetical protein